MNAKAGAASLAEKPFFSSDLRELTPLDKKNAAALLLELLEKAAKKESLGIASLKENKPAASFLSAVL
ncbi:MAG TPA: hypothetical protein VK602_03675, partial [Phyllobacterium sp.]|nr:hypothetical protein [Phyllobacterium sp.]